MNETNKSVLFINSGSLPIPASSGGAVQQVLGQIAAGMANEGWDVGVMTVMTERSRAQQAAFSMRPIRWHEIASPIRSGSVKGIWRARATVKRQLSQIDPGRYSNVVLYDPYLAPVVRRWNKKAQIVWSAHNGRSRTRFALPWWCRPVNRIVSVSRFLQADIERSVPAVAGRSHDVIHNPLEKAWLDRSAAAERERHTLLFCGRIVPEKGLHVLIEAMAQLPEPLKRRAKLAIAGGSHFLGSADNAYTIAIKRQLEQSGIAYETLGYVPHDQLMEVYDRHDIVVIPSDWDEPATLVASEGQARNCRIIASVAGGLPEMVAPSWRDYIVPRGDAQSLRSAIERMLGAVPSESAFAEVRQWLAREVGAKATVQKWERLLLSR